MRRTFTLLATGALLIASIAVAVAAGAKAGHSSQGDRGPMREGIAGNDWRDGGPRGPHGPGEGHRSWDREMLMGPEGRLLHDGGRLAETLKLTAAQRQKLSDIGDDFARQAIRARADLTVARLDLAKDLRRETPNRSEIDGRIDAVAKLRASLMKSAVEARLDARDVLTAEQRRQLADVRFRGGAK